MHRHLLFIIITLLSFVPIQAQTNKKIRSLQKEQTTLKNKIASQEKMLRTTKRDVNSQLANLQVITVQIEGQQKYVNGIHAELTELSTTIGGLEKQLALLEADLSVCKRRYQRSLSYVFRHKGSASKWQFILSAKNFRQMYRRLRYLTEFTRYQKVQAAVIRQKEDEVKAKRAELLGVRTQKNQLLAEGQEQTRKLEGQKQEREKVVNDLNQRQKELQASIAQQRKRAAQLDARIDQLIQQEIAAAERRRKAEEERRRKAALARAKAEKERAEHERKAALARAKTAKNKAAAASKNKTSASSKRRTTTAKPRYEAPREPEPTFAENADRSLTNSFAAARGRLPMPITGSYAVTRHFGQYNVQGLNGVQLDSKGINITGHSGAQARSVFRGEVTAIFSYGGMYNVIVRHGSYMTVYCNLSSTAVRRGQTVEARQTIGSVATDAAGNCTLHFQLRKETAKLNPEAWLAR